MNSHSLFPAFVAVALAGIPGTGFAYVTGHHGGLITDCTAPTFFEESPARDAKVEVFQQFSITASDNTDPATIEVRVNNHPVDVTVTKQRSGRFTVAGALPEPLAQGRVWIKVVAVSDDGCDQIHTWNVYAGR